MVRPAFTEEEFDYLKACVSYTHEAIQKKLREKPEDPTINESWKQVSLLAHKLAQHSLGKRQREISYLTKLMG